jgi:cytochrome P450
MFGAEMLFTFDPVGLRSLYQVRESDASFTEATRGLLGLKLPPAAIEGTLHKFHRAMKPDLMKTYVSVMSRVVDDSLATLGQGGTFEIFSHCKGLMHAIGFSCWINEHALEPIIFSELVQIFDQLDPEQGFQSLGSLTFTIASCKFRERRALAQLAKVVRNIHDQNDGTEHDNLSALYEANKHLSPAEQDARVALDVFQFHLASLANLYAAISWVFVNILQDPQHCNVDGIRQEMQQLDEQFGEEWMRDMSVLNNQMLWLECVIQESLRLAQQSITLRKVVRPTVVSFSDSRHQFVLKKGVYIATLLSITNVDEKSASDSELSDYPLEEFHPARYQGTCDGKTQSKLAERSCSISTFGHHFHACPGQRLAIIAIKLIVCRYMSSLSMTAKFKHASIPPASVGAIARSATPCMVEYELISN